MNRKHEVKSNKNIRQIYSGFSYGSSNPFRMGHDLHRRKKQNIKNKRDYQRSSILCLSWFRYNRDRETKQLTFHYWVSEKVSNYRKHRIFMLSISNFSVLRIYTRADIHSLLWSIRIWRTFVKKTVVYSGRLYGAAGRIWTSGPLWERILSPPPIVLPRRLTGLGYRRMNERFSSFTY